MHAMLALRPLTALPRSFARGMSSGSNPIGFIGLGQMGSRMAENLVKAGHNVVAFDVNKEAVQKLVAAGGSSAESPKAVAAAARVVVTMLPSNPHVRSVYCGIDGILSEGGARDGALLIDCSTIEPGVAKEVSAAASARGATLVDAPVSGGTPGAEKATLTFMVGGPKDAFTDAEKILQAMGRKIVHCGDVGMGQAAKLCNNMVLAISMAAVSEGHALAGRLGLDHKVLAEIVNTSSGRCWSSDTYNPHPGVMDGVPSSRGYTGGFACDLMVKDLSLATAAANSSDPRLGLPFGSLALQMYTLASAHGAGHKDFSAIYEFLREVPKKN
eukprot:TRINITY_DN17980_c0_g1_i2.p1 TRINITY_DN17980_c0_g1~~TRINITY_DN17980_c0_g1_i2.p1  ORF type:complete len:328 (+),score=63.34 TRINITY_DN17980_c0_g1_i2:30-1013(+)